MPETIALKISGGTIMVSACMNTVVTNDARFSSIHRKASVGTIVRIIKPKTTPKTMETTMRKIC